MCFQTVKAIQTPTLLYYQSEIGAATLETKSETIKCDYWYSLYIWLQITTLETRSFIWNIDQLIDFERESMAMNYRSNQLWLSSSTSKDTWSDLHACSETKYNVESVGWTINNLRDGEELQSPMLESKNKQSHHCWDDKLLFLQEKPEQCSL